MHWPWHLPWGEIVFLLAGVSIVLPLGMHVTGHPHIARRLDVIPRLVFGLIALAVGALPNQTYRWQDPGTWEDAGPAPVWASRIVFCSLGIFLLATAIRRILKREFPDDSSDS